MVSEYACTRDSRHVLVLLLLPATPDFRGVSQCSFAPWLTPHSTKEGTSALLALHESQLVLILARNSSTSCGDSKHNAKRILVIVISPLLVLLHPVYKKMSYAPSKGTRVTPEPTVIELFPPQHQGGAECRSANNRYTERNPIIHCST